MPSIYCHMILIEAILISGQTFDVFKLQVSFLANSIDLHLLLMKMKSDDFQHKQEKFFFSIHFS